eukprot:scaffold624_cov402-Prasinococcus_capsulatus_cf.AAC.21
MSTATARPLSVVCASRAHLARTRLLRCRRVSHGMSPATLSFASRVGSGAQLSPVHQGGSARGRSRALTVCSAPDGGDPYGRRDRREEDYDYSAPPVVQSPNWQQRLPRFRLYALKDINIGLVLGLAAIALVIYQQMGMPTSPV